MNSYTVCNHDECERIVGKHGAKGYCPLHYRRHKIYGDANYVKRNRPCIVSDCQDYKQTGAGYCKKHGKRYDRGQDPSLPSKYDKRASIDRGDHHLIPLGLQSLKGYAIIDPLDAHIDNYQWSRTTNGYAQAIVNGKHTLMHHIIVGKPPKGFVTDHINGNRADNRRINLRFVTQRENTLNKWFAYRGEEYSGALPKED